MADEQGRTFEDVQERLTQIVDAVSDESISLDEALALYEEAVKLGLSACDLSEQDIDAFLAAEEEAPTNAGTDPVGGDLGRPSATSADVFSAEEGGASASPTNSIDASSPADAPASREA